MATKIVILCSLLLINFFGHCLDTKREIQVPDNNNNNNNLTLTKSLFTEKNVSVSLPVQFNRSVDLGALLDIWNPELLIPVWNTQENGDVRLSSKCEEDFEMFLHGIAQGSRWALKMVDASGRHTWGLFTGSRYWIGASDQCREMENDFVELIKSNQSERDGRPDVPPFKVCVNSVSLALDIFVPEVNGSHDITMGVCMPASCKLDDVVELFKYSATRVHSNLPRKVTIDHVRNLSEGYSLWDDPIFYIILISFAFAIILVILGTSYDLALRYQVLSREDAMRNNGSRCVSEIEESKVMRPRQNYCEEITITRLWSIKQHNGSLDVWNSKDVPRPMSEALLSFSLLLNISKLASLDVGSDTLAPIHGLRFISMLWVILVHTCLMVNEVSDNKMFRSKAEEDFLYQTISNGTYAVDTFFFISGCLVAFLYFRTMSQQRMKEKKITQGFIGKIMQFIGMMSYRYFRLTPPYLLVIGLIQLSMKWYHDHSVIELTTLDYKTCEKFWWRNAIYLNTYFDMDDRCMVWSWYLANDTQFYTVGIIILIIAARFLFITLVIIYLLDDSIIVQMRLALSFVSIGATIGVVFLITSWITTATISLNTKHIATIQEPFAHYESLYDKPWTRIGPYLIGMAAGWYLCKVECKLRFNKTAIALGWSISIATLLSIVYGLYGNNLDPVTSALYTALSHSGWALSVGFILMACVTGHGGIANKILSWKYIYPLSRLTYCAYLVHPALTRAMILRGESSFHLTQGFVAILFFGITVASYAVSLFLSLLFEAPMVSLLRIVHPLRQWKQD